jgi:hypothetical protein
MKSVLFATCVALVVCACVTNTNQQTFWGKEGVSMLDYRTDGGQCAVLAATANTETSGVHTAGGISGTSTARLPPQGERSGGPTVSQGGSTPPPSGSAFPTGAGGAYRDNTAPDVVTRAATQQTAQELAAQKAKTERLKSCLVDRGYTEFSLTPEQRAHLATLPQGSDARREYLYKLGTDNTVLTSQAVKKRQ